MAQALLWKRLIGSGRQFSADRAAHARRLASALATQGQHTTSEVSAAVEELVELTRRRGGDLEAAVRARVGPQLEVLDLATSRVLAAVAPRLFGGRDQPRSRRSNEGDPNGDASNGGADRSVLTGSEVAVSNTRLVLTGDLDFDARHEFTTKAFAAIVSATTAGTQVEVDCSAVECVAAVDDAVIGMLVTLGRTARRHGSHLVLVRAPESMRVQFEAADVARFFDWKQ